jgi:hypothetical protein
MADRNRATHSSFHRIAFLVLIALLIAPALSAEWEEGEVQTFILVNTARVLEGGGGLLVPLSDPLLETVNYDNNRRQVLNRQSGHWVTNKERWDIFVLYPDIKYFGEVACYFPFVPTPEQIVEVFRNSPSHWNVLMDPRYNATIITTLELNGIAATTIMLLEVRDN